MIEIQEVQAFFFRAMLQGWAVKDAPKKSTVPGMPGFKAFTIEEGCLRLTDQYCTVQGSNMSAGQTIIWHRDVPVWIMQYGGWYEEHAIPLVKEALERAYRKQCFLGGRGIRSLHNGELRYTNRPHDCVNEFKKFSGYEYVSNPSGDFVGHHEYIGWWLAESRHS